ncbi:MAG: hypothetical protein N2C14_00785, partial [Planctomycetales bacterium]
MPLRRQSHTEERRRRLLTESGFLEQKTSQSTVAPHRAAANALEPEKPMRSGTPLLEQLPPVSDFIPRRFTTLFLMLLVGALVIAGLEGLYWSTWEIASRTTDGSIAAFDLDAEGSLAVWFSSFTLLAACVAASAVYAIRQRQVADYRARYRIWFWAACCWLAMSIDETASLHEGFKEMMTLVSGTRILGDGSAWWAGAYALILIPVGTLVCLDMKGSWLARIALASAAGCYVTAVAAQLGLIPGYHGMKSIMLEEGCEMAGNWMLLMSMTLHARCLLLHIEPTPATSEQAEAEAEAEVTATAEAEARAAAKPKAQAKTKPKATATTATTKQTRKKNKPVESEPTKAKTSKTAASSSTVKKKTTNADSSIEKPEEEAVEELAAKPVRKKKRSATSTTRKTKPEVAAEPEEPTMESQE